MLSVHDIIYKPRSGDEMKRAILSNPPVYLYSNLAKQMKQEGAIKVLEDMLYRNPDSLILLQDPDKMYSGHWISLSFHFTPPRVYFFSSYGGKPDVEKNEWIPSHKLLQSNQSENVLNDGLKELLKRGWEVHYNQYPYQIDGDNTATCGIWTAAFLNSGLNPDEFHAQVVKKNLTPAILFLKYFL